MADQIRANGFPTKGFFINMLTRDIDINDAILDLLDNCLDGVVRIQQKKGISKKTKDYYSGYEAKIHISSDSFSIEDNCGGIPLEIAQKYAFRMGRDENSPAENSATVGIYGIGMKRAIFKIGKSAIIHSMTSTENFRVEIPKEWESRIDDWNFSIALLEKTDNGRTGTVVKITDLNDSIKQRWGEDGHRESFVSELIEHIKESYSLIIERGFSVYVNGIQIEPNEVSFIFSKEERGIKPFVYTRQIGSVNVRLAVGFYAAPPSIEESDRMAEKGGQRTSKDAGWTVICNDRVVLYNNKDHLTGWGEGTVPKYHTQFIGIRGIVEFESSNPVDLPMTTTKRGVDLSSPIYSEVKKKMCEGLKLFTNFTNNWKGTANADTKFFISPIKVKLDELVGTEKDNTQIASDIKFSRTKDGGKQFKPNLPKKKNSSDTVYVRFAVNHHECQQVARFLFDDEQEHIPSDVGQACYERVKKEARIADEEI